MDGNTCHLSASSTCAPSHFCPVCLVLAVLNFLDASFVFFSSFSVALLPLPPFLLLFQPTLVGHLSDDGDGDNEEDMHSLAHMN